MSEQTNDQLLQRIQELEVAVALRTDQLVASTARSYSFLDSIHKGFMLCDISGELVLANNQLHSMMQTDQTTAITTTTIDQVMRPDLELKSLIHQCAETKQTFERDNVNFNTRILHTYITPLVGSDSNQQQEVLGVIVLIEDVTEQKMLNRSKDEFISIAAHELRTPLTAIRGNTSIIQKYYGDKLPDPELNEMIGDIHESSVRLIGIVNDFLDVAAMEQGKIEIKPELFALSEVIEDVGHELKNLCGDKGIQLICDPSLNAIPKVTADKQRIKQVLINLVGNSVKFTDAGSITLSADADDTQVRVIVTDTGKGMSLENQQLLFRKFQQAGTSLLTRDTSKGTGLGLYISKLIVELSGGTIGLVKSELDVGSSFAFTLPISK